MPKEEVAVVMVKDGVTFCWGDDCGVKLFEKFDPCIVEEVAQTAEVEDGEVQFDFDKEFS
jgi:hypothetical protein